MDSTEQLAWHKSLMTKTDDMTKRDRTRAAAFEMGCELLNCSLNAILNWNQKPATSKSIKGWQHMLMNIRSWRNLHSSLSSHKGWLAYCSRRI